MYSFGEFSFEPKDLALLKGGQPAKLEPQPAKVLAKLLERSGQIVTREELCEAVWQKGTYVEYEQGLNYCLRQIRQALGDSPSNPRFIETLPKRGYRFIAPVTDSAVVAAPQAELPARRQPRFLWIASAAVVLAVILIAGLWLARRVTASSSRSVPAVAVIPLMNRTGLAEFDAPADSLTEGLIRELSDTGLLKVFGRATMFGFRGQEKNAREAGRGLSADIVLTGHLDKVGPDISLDVEISGVRDGTILYAHRYLPGPDSWMETQADLIHDTLSALGADPGAKGTRFLSPPSSSPEAYRAYITGQSQARLHNPTKLLNARASFQHAIELDSKFALAWAELAQCELFLGIYFDDPKKWMPQARKAAQEALRLNPSLRGPKA
jgi:DNA-binding winged helix-turn-helix (wHTH) protein/TolB-like protein